MRLLPFHAVLFIGILVAAHLAPALKVMTSCCDDRVCGSQEASVLLVVPAEGQFRESDDGCCDHNAAADTGRSDRSCESGDQQAPLDDAPRDSETPDAPCDGDCRCTLCRVAMHHPIQVSNGPTVRLEAEESSAFTGNDQLIRSRDQRFDLLRPPQF